MLGPSEDEFDLLLVRNGTLEPMIFHADRLRQHRITLDDFERQTSEFEALQIQRFVATNALIQRRTTERPVFTAHRMMGPETRAHDFMWAVHYLSETVAWGAAEADRWLALADGASAAIPLPDGSATIAPWIATLKAHMMPDGVERALADADAALDQLAADSVWRPTALLARGVAHVLLGATDRATGDVTAAIEQGLETGSAEEVGGMRGR